MSESESERERNKNNTRKIRRKRSRLVHPGFALFSWKVEVSAKFEYRRRRDRREISGNKETRSWCVTRYRSLAADYAVDSPLNAAPRKKIVFLLRTIIDNRVILSSRYLSSAERARDPKPRECVSRKQPVALITSISS